MLQDQAEFLIRIEEALYLIDDTEQLDKEGSIEDALQICKDILQEFVAMHQLNILYSEVYR